MKIDGSVIIIGIIILIILENHNNYIYDTFIATKIVSSIDKRKYNVSNNYANTQEAADTMAIINNFIFNFLQFIRNKFIIKKLGTHEEQEFVKRVIKNYNPDVIFENDPKPGGDTSYVINKGDEFALCLRNKDTKKIHSDNLLQFVTIHELSHLGNTSYGHGYSFWAWFKFMLIQAKDSGLYDPVDYSKDSIEYCGLGVSFSPYFSDYYDWTNAASKQGVANINYQESIF